ncbi:MAG: IPT/TIG domain-containing protein [Verrucomicrobiota bacterium]
MSSNPSNYFLTIVKAVWRHWRWLLWVALGVVGVGGYWGYRKVNAILNPAVPKAMVVNVEIPDDVDRMGDAILKVYESIMVPSFAADPVITDVSPRSGPPGSVVTVTGTGFGAQQGLNGVALNMTEAVPKVEVLEWTDTKIRFTVPEHTTTGDVTVTLWEMIRMEMVPKGYFRPLVKNPRSSNGIRFAVTGQEEHIKLGKALFFGWTQLNEEASSLVKVPKLKINADPHKYVKYGFLPRNDADCLVDEGEADRFSEPTPVVGVRIQKGVDGEIRVGYSCAYCHTGRDPVDNKITAGLPSSTLMFGKLIAMADNIPEDMRLQADRWPPGTADLTFRYFPDGIENPTAIMLARGTHGFRYWSSAGVPMPEYQRHSNAWINQGSPYMAPLKVSIALCCYLNSLTPLRNTKVDLIKAARGRKVFDEAKCYTCHTPWLGMYTNQATIPLDVIGTNGQPTLRMKDSGGIRVAPLLSVYATAPYLHDHSVATLDDLLNPQRLLPGSSLYTKPLTRHPAHPWVVRDEAQRSDLVEFLNSL